MRQVIHCLQLLAVVLVLPISGCESLLTYDDQGRTRFLAVEVPAVSGVTKGTAACIMLVERSTGNLISSDVYCLGYRPKIGSVERYEYGRIAEFAGKAPRRIANLGVQTQREAIQARQMAGSSYYATSQRMRGSYYSPNSLTRSQTVERNLNFARSVMAMNDRMSAALGEDPDQGFFQSVYETERNRGKSHEVALQSAESAMRYRGQLMSGQNRSTLGSPLDYIQQAIGYDPTTTSTLGRFSSFSESKNPIVLPCSSCRQLFTVQHGTQCRLLSPIKLPDTFFQFGNIPFAAHKESASA